MRPRIPLAMRLPAAPSQVVRTRMLCCFTPEGYRQLMASGRTFQVRQFHTMKLYAPFLDRPLEEFRRHLADMGIDGRAAAAHLAHLSRRKRAAR